MSNEAARDDYERINREIRQANRGDLPIGRASWYGHAISDLALLLEGADVDYADVAVVGTVDAHEVTIRLFTADAIANTEGRLATDLDECTSWLEPRAGLVRLQVRSGSSVFRTDWNLPAAPGKVQVDLTYNDNRSIHLPGAEHISSEQNDQLVELIASLRRDLLPAGTGT